MTEALIGFGANLSNPKATFLTAEKHLTAQGVAVRAKSGLWTSPAWPAGSDQPDYTNAVMRVDYAGQAETLLTVLQSVERQLGRVRTTRNAARTLDLDLLDFGGLICSTEQLILPHPRMLERAFVLLPLCEIDPVWLDALAQLPRTEIDSMGYLGRW